MNVQNRLHRLESEALRIEAPNQSPAKNIPEQLELHRIVRID